MAELSVTDIQKALRDHASFGVDVTTEPGKLKLDGVSYRGLVGAQLEFDENANKHLLYGHLMPSERPVLAHIVSSLYGSPRPTHGLHVLPIVPHVIDGSSGQGHAFYLPHADSPWHAKELMHARVTYATNNQVAITPSMNHDVHDVIHRLKTTNFPHFGVKETEDESTFISHDDSHLFNLKRGIQGLTSFRDAPSAKPFSGLITVVPRGTGYNDPYNYRATHVYNPQTEELLPISAVK